MALDLTIQQYRGTYANLPTLAAGQLAFVTDTKEVVAGDGAANHIIGGIIFDTFANRPTVGETGRVFYATDTNATYIDDGSTWQEVTFTGDLDDISDGTTYGRVLQTDLSSGHVNQLSDGSNTVTVAEIAADLKGNARRESVLDYIVDNTATPPSEVTGDRFILSDDGGVPNAAYDGAAAGDLVDFNGTTWDALTPDAGWVAYSIDDGTDFLFDGSAWVERANVITNHNDLGSIQGGNGSTEYYHMTADEDGALANANTAPTAANPLVTEADAVMDGDAAGGDLTGTYPDPTVAGLRGNPIQTGTPDDKSYLKFNTTSGEWEYTKVLDGGTF